MKNLSFVMKYSANNNCLNLTEIIFTFNPRVNLSMSTLHTTI